MFAELLGAVMGRLAPGVPVPTELLEVNDMLATRAEQWKQDWLSEGRQEGRQEGRLEGRLEGRQEGQAAMLVRQMERRFGPLSNFARDRVMTADTDTLTQWGLRVLDAATIDDVFA